jgi:hypothetical protein
MTYENKNSLTFKEWSKNTMDLDIDVNDYITFTTDIKQYNGDIVLIKDKPYRVIDKSFNTINIVCEDGMHISIPLETSTTIRKVSKEVAEILLNKEKYNL